MRERFAIWRAGRAERSRREWLARFDWPKREALSSVQTYRPRPIPDDMAMRHLIDPFCSWKEGRHYGARTFDGIEVGCACSECVSGRRPSTPVSIKHEEIRDWSGRLVGSYTYGQSTIEFNENLKSSIWNSGMSFDEATQAISARSPAGG